MEQIQIYVILIEKIKVWANVLAMVITVHNRTLLPQAQSKMVYCLLLGKWPTVMIVIVLSCSQDGLLDSDSRMFLFLESKTSHRLNSMFLFGLFGIATFGLFSDPKVDNLIILGCCCMWSHMPKVPVRRKRPSLSCVNTYVGYAFDGGESAPGTPRPPWLPVG